MVPLIGLQTWYDDYMLVVGGRGPAAVISICLLAASLMSGCSTSDGLTTVLIDPGHYSAYHCDGLVARLKALQAREQELSNLMARASEGGGGALIGNLTYRADYENTVGQEKVLRRTAAEKNCDLTAPLPPGAPAPAAVDNSVGSPSDAFCGSGRRRSC